MLTRRKKLCRGCPCWHNNGIEEYSSCLNSNLVGVTSVGGWEDREVPTTCIRYMEYVVLYPETKDETKPTNIPA